KGISPRTRRGSSLTSSANGVNALLSPFDRARVGAKFRSYGSYVRWRPVPLLEELKAKACAFLGRAAGCVSRLYPGEIYLVNLGIPVTARSALHGPSGSIACEGSARHRPADIFPTDPIVSQVPIVDTLTDSGAPAFRGVCPPSCIHALQAVPRRKCR